MNWQTVALKDCCQTITDGDHQAPPQNDKGIPFITISNIISNNIDFTETMYVQESYYNSLDDKRKAKKGDILYSVVGSFGIPVFIKHDKKFVFQRHIAILRPNLSLLEPRFLFYTMLSRDFFVMADTVAIGAAQRTISLTALRNLKIKLPPLQIQRHIINILSAYDDLIENNQKQIKLLEEAAQRLYKEWFVDLRFPGHENTRIVDGVPEGWEKFPFSSKVSIMSGGTPKTTNKSFYEGEIPFYTPKDYPNNFFVFDTELHISNDGLLNCNSAYFPSGTIIITARGTVGKTVILGIPMAMNQSCYALKSDDLGTPYYLFFSINQEVSKLKVMSNGGVFNTIITKTFDNIHITIPNNNLHKNFDNNINFIMEKIKKLLQQNKLLQEMRNTLLPKLIK